MIPDDTKRYIDSMSYKEMLTLWRNAPAGHPYFQGEVGDYYTKIMAEKRKAISDEDHTRISKEIGWRR